MRRIAGLDGLRALAVTGVLLNHGGLAAVPGGFLGVDLFFVLSGFLITTMLLDEVRRAGTVDVMAFWGRRVHRLLPALVLVTGSTVVMAALVSSIDPPGDASSDALAALLYVANWHLLANGDGYFEQLAAPSPLQHTWSLAIEEQFYAVLPLLLLLALRSRTPRWVQLSAVAAAAIASAAWMSFLQLTSAPTDRLFYGTDTRAQSILVGVVVAYLLEPRLARRTAGHGRPTRLGGWWPGIIGVAGLTGVVVAMVLVDAEVGWLYRGGLSGFAVASAALVAAVACSPRGAVTRVLELRPMRYVGALSYGLYLWHWPVFLLMTAGRTSLSGSALLAGRLAATLALAIASLHLVENPLRRADWRLRRALTIPAGAVAVACGLLLVAPQSLTSTDSGRPRPAGPGGAPAVSVPVAADPGTDPRPLPSEGATSATRAARPQALRVTVLGDSTARTLADGLRDVPGATGVDFHNAAVLGCGIASGTPYIYRGEIDPYERERCSAWADRWRRVVVARPVDVVAVLVGRWEVADQVVDGVWTHVGEPRFDRHLRGELAKAVRVAASTGAEVAFLTAPYCNRGEQPDGSSWPEDEPARVDAFNDVLRSVAAGHPGTAHVIELGRRTAAGGHRYVNEVDGVVLRYDGVHFTAEAAQWLQPWLVRELAQTTGG